MGGCYTFRQQFLLEGGYAHVLAKHSAEESAGRHGAYAAQPTQGRRAAAEVARGFTRVSAAPLPRTRREMLLDLRYGAVYNEMNCRFYSTLKIVLSWLGFFCGSGVVYGFLKQPEIAVPSGIFLAAVAALGYSLAPETRAVALRDRFKEYVKLEGRASKLGDEELEEKLFDLKAGSLPYSLTALKNPAQNAVVRKLGAPEQKLTLYERLFTALS
jgi:hypothetical protein